MTINGKILCDIVSMINKQLRINLRANSFRYDSFTYNFQLELGGCALLIITNEAKTNA